MPIVPGSGTEDNQSSATGDRVRVVDAALPAPPAPEIEGRGVKMLAGFGGLMVLALWLFSGGEAPAESVAEVEPVTLAAAVPEATTAAMPDLVDLALPEAEATMAAAGFGDVQWAVSWRASHRRDLGRILSQTPAPGVETATSGAVEVVLSEGGPVVGFTDLPAAAKAFASELPGHDPDTPLVARATPAGVAYKNDDWLFGECAAVELAYRSFADASYGTECFVRETTSVAGVLIDGTRYQVWGLPNDQYGTPAPSGVLVYETEDDARALGITTYEESVVGGDVTAAISDGALTIAGGRWRSRVAIDPDILGGVADTARLAAAVRPRLDDGHLVVDVDPPLRWQRPGELPSRIAADYGAFRVVAGCVANVVNVVCDPSGSISVEGVQSGFEVRGVVVQITTDDLSRRTMVDPLIGLGWELAASWNVAEERLTEVTFPREVFSAGTYPLRPGGSRCAHMPENALRDLGADDVLISVFAGGGGEIPPWPHPIDWSHFDTGFTDAQECADRPGLKAGVGSFSLDTVPLVVVVAVGDRVTAETKLELWRLLDSLTIAPNIWWTP